MVQGPKVFERLHQGPLLAHFIHSQKKKKFFFAKSFAKVYLFAQRDCILHPFF